MVKPCKRGHTEKYATGKCKICARQRGVERWAANREEMHAKRAVYRKANREKIRLARNRRYLVTGKAARRKYTANPEKRAIVLLGMARTRARKNGLDFNLTAADIVPALTTGACEATGIPFAMDYEGRNPFTPSLDRISPAKGYVKGNVQVVIWALNAMRGTWGDDVLLQVADALKASR